MRKLWECKDWSTFVTYEARKGVRLKFDKEVHDEVKRACKEFVCWLREEYEFPIRIPIYFKESEHVVTSNGEYVSAIFFGPYDKMQEPYIKIAVGDYVQLEKVKGKDNALAAILNSIAHELSHYYQWIKDINDNQMIRERQARYYAKEILYDYAETREHP